MPFEFLVEPGKSKDPDGLHRDVFKLFQQHGNEFNSRLIIERMSGRPGVNRRSGALATGWLTMTQETGNGIETTNWLAGPAADKNGKHGYGWIQENGGDIVPVKAEHLWIPILFNQTPTGVPKITPTEAIKAGGHVSPINNIWFGHLAKGDGKTVPLFKLVDSVHIEPRLGAYNMWVTMTRTLDAALAFTVAGYV